MSEEIIRSVLLKAGFKTFFVFLVVTTLDYFFDESDLLDQVNDFGFKIWILIFKFRTFECTDFEQCSNFYRGNF